MNFSFSLPLVFCFASLLGTAVAQVPVFGEVRPVYDFNTGAWDPFPVLKNMQSAWGDIDSDGDSDVILMGEGPLGPITKLFQNESSAVNPYAFAERHTSLPALQDGSLAWGDVDGDGALDLAMTGSVRPTQSAQTEVNPDDLRAYVFRNSGPSPSGLSWQFEDIHAQLQPTFGGCVSWRDIDNDGDQDLFVSGLKSENRLTYAFAHLYENIRGFLSLVNSQRFLSSSGSEAARQWQSGVEHARDPETSPTESDVNEIRRVIWMDVNRDSFPDMVLAYHTVVGDLAGQDIYINLGPAVGAGRFERWNDQLANQDTPAPVSLVEIGAFEQLPWTPELRVALARRRVPGGVGDWDGDGWTDLVHVGVTYNTLGTGQALLLHRLTASQTWLPEDLVPGFRTQPNVPHNSFLVSNQISADLLNSGRVQWLGSVITQAVLPEFRCLVDDENHGLADVTADSLVGLKARFAGVLDVVDVNGDGRLDVLHSGYEEGSTLETVFYRNGLPLALANTPPGVPGGLEADATKFHIYFRWNPSTDSKTPAATLRYAIKLRHSSGTYFLRPGATDTGNRHKPGLEDTLETTEFHFNAHNGGNGIALPDGTYFWSVQAVDSGGMGSAFAPEQSFFIDHPSGPPPAGDSGERNADLSWRDAALDAGDVDNDGDLDLVLAGRRADVGSNSTIIRRNGGPDPSDPNRFAFSGLTPDLPELLFGAVRWGDVDGDGDLDLAVSGSNHGQPLTRIYRNHNGTLEIRNRLDGVQSSALDWGDFDNDGDLDLVVTGYRDKKPLTRLYRNGGQMNQSGEIFPEQPSTLPDIGNGAVAWGDYDNDGDLDLLLCGDTQTYDQPLPPSIPPPYHLRPPGASYLPGPTTGQAPLANTTLFRNDGFATRGSHAGKWIFTPLAANLPACFSYQGGRSITARAEWCDMTGDGLPDLLLGGMRAVNGYANFGVPSARIYLNGGAGLNLGEWTFQEGGELLSSSFDHALQSLTLADWNQDGWLDVLLGGWINGPGTVPAQVRTGNGGRYFDPPRYLPTTLPGAGEQFAGGPAVFGHFDGDANVDIVLAARWGIQNSSGGGNFGSGGRIFLNDPLPANIRPTPPNDLTASISGTEITLSWGESSDGITPVHPTYNLHVERVDGQPGGMPGMADLTTGQRRVARHGNVGQHRSWKLRNLPAGEYRWSVQAIDSALATSAFTAAAQTFTAPPPVIPLVTPLPPLHQWFVGNPNPMAVDVLSIVTGRQARLLTGPRGQLYLSRNRGPFAQVESGVFTDLYDGLIEMEGATVVGDAGVILTSNDGAIWQTESSGSSASLRTITRGGNGWVTAGDGVVLHSPTRATWTAGTLPAGAVIHDLTWAFNRYLAVGERNGTGMMLASTDGLVWTETSPAGMAPGRITGLATDGTKAVATGGNDDPLAPRSDLFTTNDGLVWTIESSATAPIVRIAHSTEGWYAVTPRQIFGSTDAVTWTWLYDAGFIEPHFAAISVDDGFVTAGGSAGTLFDSPVATISFTRRGGNAINTYGHEPTMMVAVGDLIIAVGESGLQYISRDGGRTWQGAAFVVSDAFYGLAVGPSGIVRSHIRGFDHTTDGGTWTPVALSRPTRGLAFGNGRFVAPRFFGGFFVSTTGLTWDTVSTDLPEATALAFGNGMFMTLDAAGNVRVSLDGAAWNVSGVVNASRLCFAHDRFFAILGDLVQTSVDGVLWETVNGLPAGVDFTSVVWHRDRYVITGGPDALLLTSPDLATWTRVPIPASGPLHTALSFDGGLLVAGSGQGLLLATDNAPPNPSFGQVSLTAIERQAPNIFAFTITGTTGQVVTLERSSDLNLWIEVQTFTLSGATETLEVEVPGLLLSDYFRLRWDP